MTSKEKSRQERDKTKKSNQEKVDELKKKYPFLDIKATTTGITIKLAMRDFDKI